MPWDQFGEFTANHDDDPHFRFKESMAMQQFQLRVMDEKCELDQKLGALRRFLTTTLFCNLDENERKRMIRQEAIMSDYSQVLADRIHAFS